MNSPFDLSDIFPPDDTDWSDIEKEFMGDEKTPVMTPEQQVCPHNWFDLDIKQVGAMCKACDTIFSGEFAIPVVVSAATYQFQLLEERIRALEGRSMGIGAAFCFNCTTPYKGNTIAGFQCSIGGACTNCIVPFIKNQMLYLSEEDKDKFVEWVVNFKLYKHENYHLWVHQWPQLSDFVESLRIRRYSGIA